MDATTLQKINEPTFINDLCDHVTQGGGLPNLCQHLKIKYSDVVRWIYSSPELSKQYELALASRQQWFIQSILNELKDIAFADLREAYDEHGNLLAPHLLPPNIAKVIQAIETEELYEGQGPNRENIGTAKRIKSWDKLRALELLGKNLSMFKEQVEHSGELTLEQLVLGSMKEVIDGTAQSQTGAPSGRPAERISAPGVLEIGETKQLP